ncbi:MAG: sialate O-acetylesterase [Akkermansiaceae bacterium]|nr:sialate O-acetylesterase [Akkermansiaceae bacterium]
MHCAIRLLFPVLFLTLTSFTHAGDRHLFILSGQSNMAGLKPESSFLPELTKLLPGADIQHVKFARGGQPIRKWVKSWDEIAKKHDLKPLNDPGAFYDVVLKEARANLAEGKPKTITFLWMQGERDGKTGLAGAYEESLRTLIANLRKDLDAPEMNFVIGRLCDHLDHEQWNGVRAAQVKVAGDDPRGAWVDTDDTNDKEKNGRKWNDLHYTKAGYDLFGQRLARQAVRLIKGEKPDPQGRPE